MCITKILPLLKRKTENITPEFLSYLATAEDLKERTIYEYAGDLNALPAGQKKPARSSGSRM